MKKGPEAEPQRGMEEVQAQLAKDQTAEVTEGTILSAQQLLSEFVGSMNITLRPKQLKTYLELLVANTEFEGTVVMYRGEAQPDSFRTYPAYDYRMQAIFGHYPHDAYNIWFQRSEGKWILNYNKIPRGGNYRGHDGWASE